MSSSVLAWNVLPLSSVVERDGETVNAYVLPLIFELGVIKTLKYLPLRDADILRFQ